MKSMMDLMMMLALVLSVLVLVVPPAIALAKRMGRRVAANTITGTHAGGVVTRSAEEAFATRYLLCKTGTAPATQVLICTDGDKPLGVVADEPASGDYANVQLLGNVPGTLLMVASEALTAGGDVYTADDGKVQNLPGSAGTYYKVGRNLNAAAADGDVVEVAHHHPIAVTVS